MVMGAACGFAAASLSGSTAVGIVAGIAAGAILSCLFALMVLVFAANQVASGLALTIFGLGLSGLIGRDFVGKQINAVPEVHIPA